MRASVPHTFCCQHCDLLPIHDRVYSCDAVINSLAVSVAYLLQHVGLDNFACN